MKDTNTNFEALVAIALDRKAAVRDALVAAGFSYAKATHAVDSGDVEAFLDRHYAITGVAIYL